MASVAVLIPARNEAECLPELLGLLEEAGVTCTVVVDNGSVDGTGRIAEELGAAVVRVERPGYGRACRAGIRYLASLGPPPAILVFVDADDTLAPAQIAELARPIQVGSADLVIGERRAEAGVAGVRPHAALGNALVTTVLRGVYGARERDLGPFRAIRFTSLEELALDDEDYGWYVQMQVRAYKQRLRVRAMPVAFRARTVGRSKVSGSVTASVRAGIKILWTLAIEVLRAPAPGGEPIGRLSP